MSSSAEVVSPRAEADSAWQQLRCPDCLGMLVRKELDRGAAALGCASCAQLYSIERGIPLLIGRKSELNQSEVETQDRVSDHYAGVRYQRPSSLRYHEDVMAQLVELAPPRGNVLDD